MNGTTRDVATCYPSCEGQKCIRGKKFRIMEREFDTRVFLCIRKDVEMCSIVKRVMSKFLMLV